MARNIGDAFDRDSIEVDRVVSSPLCRASYTAELAFDHVNALVAGLREPEVKKLSDRSDFRRCAAAAPLNGAEGRHE